MPKFQITIEFETLEAMQRWIERQTRDAKLDETFDQRTPRQRAEAWRQEFMGDIDLLNLSVRVRNSIGRATDIRETKGDYGADAKIPAPPHPAIADLFTDKASGRLLSFDEWKVLVTTSRDYRERLRVIRNFGAAGIKELLAKLA